MVKDTEKFISSCEICQTTKWTSQRMPGLLHQLPILDAPWTSIMMDFVGPFPKSLNSNYLWVIVCHLTSQVHLVPIKMTTNALELTYEFLKNIVCLHGVGGILVLCANRLFDLQMYHAPYKSRILWSGCFFDWISRSAPKPAIDIS